MSVSGHRLVVSAAAETRLRVARDWLASLDGAAALVLAPSRGAADDFVHGFVDGLVDDALSRRPADGAARPGVFGVERLTLDLLAGRLTALELAAEDRAPISPLGSEALCALVVADALESGDLSTLAPVADTPNFPRALRRTVSELRLADLAPSSLVALPAPGPDVSSLLERYGSELEGRGLADRAERLRRAAAALARGEGADLRGRPSLWLDVGVEAQLEERLLEQLASALGAVLWALPSGDSRGVDVACRILGVEPEILDGDPPRTRLERVQRWIFPRGGGVEASLEPWEGAGDEVEGGAEGSTSVELVFFSAAGEGMECVEIARRVRDLASEGVPYDRMAIVLRQPTAYLPLVEDALRRAQIEAHFARGTTRPHPAGRAFLSLVACALENLSASRFAEYLSLGEVPELREDASPEARDVPFVEPDTDQYLLFGQSPTEASAEASVEREPPAGVLPTPMHWERLLVDAAVVGGVDRWQRRLAGLDAELERRMREVGDEEVSRRAGIARDRERLRRLRGFALPIVEALAALPETASWGVWLEGLERLAVLALRRPDSVLTVLAELRPMAEVGPVALGQVHQVLAERLGFLREAPSTRRFGRVFVGTIPELAGRSFEVVFVPGLAEGIFPRPTSEDPLLLDEQRAVLDAGLADRDEKARLERMLLRTAVGAARRKLVVSYPRVDVSHGRSRVPSFYALDVLRAADGKVPSLTDLQKRAARASASRMGWPAPDRPQEAIDAAEYDLALLRPFLEPGARDVRGQGRFLLKTNAHLARTLSARARRWRRPFTYADGLVLGDEKRYGEEPEAAREAAELLRAEGLDVRSYSPTALQNYAVCPYRFLLQAIHRLRPRLDVAGFEQLDPLTRGSIFHQIQFELQGQLRDEGLLPVTPDNLSDVLDRADGVFERIASEAEEELAPAIPRVWASELDSLRNDLRGWLRRAAEDGAGWRPVHFELAFGLAAGDDRDPTSTPEPVTVLDRIRVRGSIDLVELDAAGERLRVVDHKTGRARDDRDLVVGGGEVLQPLLYALAAEQLLGDDGRRQVSSGRLFYCTLRGGYRVLEVPLDLRGRNAIRDVVQRIEKALADGFFPAAPREGACRWCDYRSVCGPSEERRLELKDRRALESLDELRRMR